MTGMLKLEDKHGDVLEVDPDDMDGKAFFSVLRGPDDVDAPNAYLTRDQVTELRDYLTAWLGEDRDVKGRPCGVTPARSCNCPGDGECPALEPDNVVPLSPRLSAVEDNQTILTEAEALVYGDRQGDYGHPRQDFTRTALLWTGVLMHKLAEGEHITPEDIALCMVQVKISREVNKPKRDNRVDGAGYLLCLDRLETGL